MADRRQALAARARARNPGVAVSDSDLFAFLGERTGGADPGDDRAAELYLACACARGDGAAIALFDNRYRREVDLALSRLARSEDALSELRQALYAQLFVGEPGRRPKILEFGGRGELRGWVRVTAVRLALKQRRRDAREVPVEDDALADLAVADAAAPEIPLLRSRFRAPFSASFRAALAALPPRDQNLLRQHHLDGVSLEALARLHGVHRATAARWLARARDALLVATKAGLMKEAALSRSECRSVMRLVQADLDLTLRRLLEGA
jgi:RNA polymerase sigma-70 factor (ECF subfamily)